MTNFDLRNQRVGTQYIAGRDIIIASDAIAAIEHRRNRSIMLDRVEFCWITSVLDKSLQNAAPIILSLEEQPDAVETPWKVGLYLSNTSLHPLSRSKHITDIYDYAQGNLLILGESGSGKTTLLLQLTRDLLGRAREDENHRMPVVFNLTSWTVKQQRLNDWLVDELNNTYHIPYKLGQAWIDNDLVLPLLDGLDRVPQKYRTKCINAINTYRRNHGLVPTVVCCQSSSYLTQEAKLLLNTAVLVQSLTRSQIDAYLSAVDGNSGMLRSAMIADPILQELAQTPLMLTMLPLVSQEESVQEALLRADSPSELRRYVLATFVNRMLHDPRITSPFTPEQLFRWLTWLAWQMSHHNQAVFYIERLQPDWLIGSRFRKYYRGSVRLLVGLLSGLILGLFSFVLPFDFNSKITDRLLVGIISGLIAGVLFGLSTNRPILQMFYGSAKWKETEKIRPVEVVVWSWASMLRSLFKIETLKSSLLVGLLGLITVPFFGLRFGAYSTIMFIGVALLVTGLRSGLSHQKLKKRRFPNQGIWYSVRNSVVVGLLTGISRGLLGGLILGSVFGSFGIVFGVEGGVCLGLMAGLSSGGLASIQHFTLRELLFLSKYTPRNYSRFLLSAAKYKLIYSIGGGYIFFHPQLQDYFASQVNDCFPTLHASEKQIQDIQPESGLKSKKPRTAKNTKRRQIHYQQRRRQILIKNRGRKP